MNTACLQWSYFNKLRAFVRRSLLLEYARDLMTQQYITPIVIEPSNNQKATSCVIWLHGLGADGNDFASIVPQLDLPSNHGIKFIFPTANMQPLTFNGGLKMRSWYDITSINLRENVDLKGVGESVKYVNSLIQSQVDLGTKPENILLAGFSQGGLVVLMAGLMSDLKLAGVIALSTYFPKKENVPNLSNLKHQNNDLPIFMAHGIYDDICPLTDAQASSLEIESLGYNVNFFEYKMAHQVCTEEILEIRSFIVDKLLK